MNSLAPNKISRWKEILFHAYFIFMFVMAYQFFKERLYADSSYYIFNTIDSGFFVTPHQRIVLAISEVVPLIFFYLGASLKTIIVAWSLGHVLFYYGVFLIAFYKFRNEGAALAVILLNVIGQTWLYFSPMLEICYGAALLVIFKILLDENKLTRSRWFWMIILEIFILTSHPENFVIFFFVIGYDMLKNGFRKNPHILLLLVFIATIIFKTQTFSEYEGGKINFMTDTHQNHLYENLWNHAYLSDLWSLFRQHYFDLMLLFLVTLVFLIIKKKILRFSFFVGMIAGVVVLVNATNFARDYSRYNESLYYPLVSIVAIAFSFEVYQVVKNQWQSVLLGACIIIACFRISEIRTNGNYLSLRVQQIEGMIMIAHETRHGKCIVNIENAEHERWFLNWSCPIESILLSSMYTPDSTVSLIPNEEFNAIDTGILLTENKAIIRRWEIRDNENVLPFFGFRKENYFQLNSADTITAPDDFHGKINLAFNSDKPGVFIDRLFFSLALINSSGKSLTSMPVETCYLKTICERSGNRIESDIPLDVDVRSNYIQTVSCPAIQGSGELNVTTKLIWKGVELASASRRFDMK